MSEGAKEVVGVVGVGRMGLAMLKHMIRNGYETVAYDINAEALKKAEEAGAKPAATPGEVGKLSTFVILAVGFDNEVNEIVFDKGGLMETMAPGSIIAISSTVAPSTAQEIERRVAEKGIEVLDAPICRGRFYVDAGTLLSLLGGKNEVVERGRPIYSCFSSDIAHLGDVGHGQVGKAMNNLLLWINGVALIEVGRIAESTGIDLVTLKDALQMSSGKTQALDDWDQISFTWALKDMQIVADMADAAKISFPVTGLIKELVKDAKVIKATNAPQWTGKPPVAYS